MTLIISKGHLWPLQLPDSWGKMPDGIMLGNIMPWGMMEECTSLDVKEVINWPVKLNTTFRGKYCLVSYMNRPVDTEDAAWSFREDEEDAAWPFREDEEDAAWPSARVGAFMTIPAMPPIFSYGTCMPSSCTEDDLRVSLDKMLEGVEKSVNNVDCQTKDQVKTLTAGDIVFIIILAILGFLLLAGAIVDISINYWDVQHYRKGSLKYLLVFSAYTNLKKIFNINNNESPEVISCLHSLRVLSMAWVVWGHGYMFLIDVTNNILGTVPLTDDVIDQTVTNATYSVDSFFFMSGLLVAYGIHKEYKRVKKVNWIMYYVHRFLRLTPPIAFTAAAMATVSRFALYGPKAPSIERTNIQNCRDYWYTDVFYASNFVHPNCLPQCWYTAVDTQLYIVLPLVLIPLVYKPKIGLPWLAVLTAGSFAIPTAISGVYRVPPALFFIKPGFKPDNSIDTYMTPWCRANSYLIGVWAGWLLYSVRKKKLKIPVWAALLGWLVAAVIGLLVIYGMTDYNTLDNPKKLPLGISTVYAGFSRGAWCLALLWVVFACHTGYGGPINSFMGHPSWQPLSRLTYSMYLTTIPTQLIYRGMTYMPLYLNHLNKITETFGYLFIGGLLAVVVSLMTEGPILGLEKLMFQRPGRGIQDTAEAKSDGPTPLQPIQQQHEPRPENEMKKEVLTTHT
ncbi:nose resistant to fluoxetine protein 6-like [Panulirus ornatus]|uniref:nose resistant to fluoxetine protein 6-like n=1 Tax=Panulirus ornatus TaxID=150431 RepID=UPI003A8801B8